MLYKRQRMLLGFLHTLGGSMRNRDFQKLLLLYTMEVEEDPSYRFVPYQYGCFSYTSYADRRKLVSCGYLDQDDKAWRLTKAGKAEALQNPAMTDDMVEFSRQLRLRGKNLIAETYRRYPYYATRSEIIDTLNLNAQERNRIEACRPPRKEAGLLTVGYEGRTLEDYINVLFSAGVTVLCDVRRNPLSRKYGFSKGVLSRTCEGFDIRYEHVPELGISSKRRKNLKTKADYRSLFKAYVRDTISIHENILQEIRSWILKGERVALTCFEHEPKMCHRHCVADALTRLGESPSCVEHL